MVIDPVIFKKEIDALSALGVDVSQKLLVSKKAHLILPSHAQLDRAAEAAKGKEKIGSTLKGIGPTYMDKTGRNGLRVGDILSADFETRYAKLVAKHAKLLSMYGEEVDRSKEAEWKASLDVIRALPCVDSEQYINDAVKNGKSVLAEGAQGSLLDIDFGTYPYVTSSNTVAAGACTGLGIAPNKIGKVFGIFKAYCTRVGSGPFPTELYDAVGEELQEKGHEFGATTGRPRRCGWVDLPALKYAIMVNGVTHLNMMKADVLSGFDHIKVCTHYDTPEGQVDHLPFELNDKITPVYKDLEGWSEDLTSMSDSANLPAALESYIEYLEAELEVPISIVSVGPDRTQTISRNGVLA